MFTLYFGISSLAWVGIVVSALIFAGLLRLKLSGPPIFKALDLPAPDDPTGINRTKVYYDPKGFRFKPFHPKGEGIPLSQAELLKDEELLSVERNGQRHLYAARQMGYHHIAQHEMAGEPYMVSF